jgi:hypothetical protein
MPPYIRIAELRPEHLTPKLHDQTCKSLFILAMWADMKAIVKAVMLRHVNLFVRVTSDNEILHAYVGNMSKKSRSENEVSFENVGDFIGPPGLAVIRLNAITRPNKAAAGALEEALVIRSDQDKPTWLVSDMDRPFISNSPAYSESLWDLIEIFPKIRISPILPRGQTTGLFDLAPVGSSQSEPESPITTPDSTKKRIKPKPKDLPTVDNDDNFNLSIYGSGINKKKNFGRE